MENKLKTLANNNNSPEVKALEVMLESGVVVLNSEGLPIKAPELQGSTKGKRLSDIELCAIVLPHVRSNFGISIKQLARDTCLNPATIRKIKKLPLYYNLLSESTNLEMVETRALAVSELFDLIANKDTSPNVKAKCIDIALRHSEEIAKISLLAKTENKATLEEILKELEDM